MKNPFKVFFSAFKGSGNSQDNGDAEELKQAEEEGNKTAEKVAKRLGIVPQVKVNEKEAAKVATKRTKGEEEKSR